MIEELDESRNPIVFFDVALGGETLFSFFLVQSFRFPCFVSDMLQTKRAFLHTHYCPLRSQSRCSIRTSSSYLLSDAATDPVLS